MTDEKRRNFLRLAGATAVIPVSAVVGSRLTHAADMPMVDPESPQAVALQYVATSEMEGQNCANCALYQGEEGAEGGPCPLFQGSHVGTGAWCSAWVTRG